MKVRAELHQEARKFGGNLLVPINQTLISRYHEIPDFRGYCAGSAIYWLWAHAQALTTLSYKEVNTLPHLKQFEENIRKRFINEFKSSVSKLQEKFEFIIERTNDFEVTVTNPNLNSSVNLNQQNSQLTLTCLSNLSNIKTDQRKNFVDQFCLNLFQELTNENLDQNKPNLFFVGYHNTYPDISSGVKMLGHALGVLQNFPLKGAILFFDSETGIFAFPTTAKFIAWMYNTFISKTLLQEYDMKYADMITFNITRLTFDSTHECKFVEDVDYKNSRSINSWTALNHQYDYSKDNIATLNEKLSRFLYDIAPGKPMDEASFILDEIYIRKRHNPEKQITKSSLFKQSFNFEQLNQNDLSILNEITYIPLHELILLTNNDTASSFIIELAQLQKNRILNSFSKNDRALFFDLPNKNIQELQTLLNTYPRLKNKHIEFFAIYCLSEKLGHGDEGKIQQKKSAGR